ncbi:MAG: helix-turn-helix transcriptional regulator [Clostridiales bacterium]|nr:helix-turn-helix transcriptional regulator [Clostridiales bacterium]
MIKIITGGIYTRHNTNFCINRPQGFPHYVLLIIKSQARLTISDKDYKIMPDSALVICPNTPYYYDNPDGEYINDWLHFDIVNDKAIDTIDFLPLEILNCPFPVRNGPAITSYIHKILWENSYSSETIKRDNIQLLFTIILNHLRSSYNSRKTRAYSPYLYKLQQLRLSLQASPATAITAREASSKLGISLSYFEHLYSDLFGVSYHKDVIAARIDYAKELLLGSDLTTAKIGFACGYNSEVHFFRQFKAITGMTPAAYREG